MAAVRWRALWLGLLAGMALHGPTPAADAPIRESVRSILGGAKPDRAVNYRLEIEAPEVLVSAIRNRTLLGRWVSESDFQVDQLPLFVDLGHQEVEAIARDAGYFSARVEIELEPVDEAVPGSVPVVRVVVDGGARTTVAAFSLSIDGPPAAQALRGLLIERWPQPEGSFFRPSEWDQGKRLMLELLRQKGFVRARLVASEARVDVQSTAASLVVRIDAGQRLAFGPLEVSGLQRYERSIVESLRTWPVDGEPHPYDLDELLRFQARLAAAGYFSSVDVLPDFVAVAEDPQLEAVPITVVVRERRRQRANVGIGYSTDDGPRLLLGYEHRDLFGKDLQLDSGVLWQGNRHRVFASVRTPETPEGYFDQVGARLERLDVQNELTDRFTLFVGRGTRDVDIDHFVSLQYQTEARTVPQDPATDNRQALTPGYSWTLRRVDSPVDPREGYTFSAQVSGALRGLLTDRSFGRLWGRAMRFWKMPSESSLAGGVLVGLLEAGEVYAAGKEDIPSENLFRTGGSQTIRGYRFLSLGVEEGGAIVGGRVLALASLEYQHPVSPGWYGAVFVDGGNAADRWRDWDAVYGYGVGVRWRSPVGPLSIDLAYGEASRDLRLHLSVGYSF
jgi:translocation and assembly module TamA